MTAEAMRNHVHKLVQPTDSEWRGILTAVLGFYYVQAARQ
jgi:hypothetical protein